MRLHVWLKGLTILCFLRKVISSLVMSLSNVPSTAFPLIFSSPTTTQTPLTGIRLNPCPTLLCGGPSGHLASPTSNTEDEEEVTGLLFFCWLALKRQKRESDVECFCLGVGRWIVFPADEFDVPSRTVAALCLIMSRSVQVPSATEMCFVFLCVIDVE